MNCRKLKILIPIKWIKTEYIKMAINNVKNDNVNVLLKSKNITLDLYIQVEIIGKRKKIK